MLRQSFTLVLFFSIIACGQITEQPSAEVEVSAEPAETSGSPIASADGLQIAYSEAGDGDVAVVLIHGWMCDQSYWDEQVPFLAEHYRVVTIDLGGHGESGMHREGWPLAAFATDVEAVVKHLDLSPVLLVGHSMGGPVALQAAALLGDRVLGVVGVDTLHNVEAKYDPEQVQPFLHALENDFPTACEAFVRDMFTADADTELIDHIASDMCSGPSEVGSSLMRQFMDTDIDAIIAATSVPVRSINADKWPTDVEVNRKHAADYDVVIVEGVGHFLMMEKPATFNPILADVLMEIAHASL